MKNFLLLLLFSTSIVACSEKTQETQSDAYIPELEITDSLVIDRLTRPYLVDVNSDRSEYLFHDFQTDEFLRVTASGEVIFAANRKEDGPNSYQEDYFYSADYVGDSKILILTYNFAFYYDLEFKLLEKKELDFHLETRNAGGSRALEVLDSIVYTFSIENSEYNVVFAEDGINLDYPFLTLRSVETLAKVTSASIPVETQIRKYPANYVNKDPLILEKGEELWMLYPNSPELYIYKKENLKLERTINLDPNDTYKQISPPNPEIGFDGFLKELASSSYIG